MAVEHLVGLWLALRPDRDMRVGAGGGDAPILEPDDRIYRVIMETHHLFGHVARERPADRRSIEAAGNGATAVGRDRQRPHRAAMAAQLGLRRDKRDGEDRNNYTAAQQSCHRSVL